MKTGLFLFTHDLRLQDNRALFEAARQCERLILLYVIDEQNILTQQYQCQLVGEHRQAFIMQALNDLAQQLLLLDQKLLIVKGDTTAVLSALIESYRINHLFYSATGDYRQQQLIASYQRHIANLAEANQVFDVTWQGIWQHTLFDVSQLPFASDEVPATFSKFRRLLEKQLPEITKPQQLTSLPPMPEKKAPETKAREKLMSKDLQRYDAQLMDVSDNNDLSSSLSPCDDASLFEGGSHAGELQLAIYFQSELPQHYKETRNALDDWSSSTKFSPWLASGCVSPRQVYWALKKHERLQGENESTYWIFFELLWREYFHWLALKIGKDLYAFTGGHAHKPLTSFHGERFIKWQLGLTPYPLVNAIMHQLNSTGYISNRARQITASCLVNELSLDWRYGAAYFQQQLIDYDAVVNWGNWQYIAGVGADPRGGRHFNLEKQQHLFDPNGDYIARWQGEQQAAPIDSVDIADWPIAHGAS